LLRLLLFFRGIRGCAGPNEATGDRSGRGDGSSCDSPGQSTYSFAKIAASTKSASVSSVATGLEITGNAAGSNVTLQAISSGNSEALAILGGAATGATPTPTGQGIASQLFESLKGIAQQYMMYSSSPSSPITDADLNKYVASYLQQYTGTGSYGSSNLMNGANQSFTEQMQTMASQLYPTLATSIKMGTAPATYTAPIQNLITNTMGLTQGSVDAILVALVAGGQANGTVDLSGGTSATPGAAGIAAAATLTTRGWTVTTN
jgi:hypothetical protein